MKNWLLLILFTVICLPPAFATSAAGEENSVAHRVSALEKITADHEQDIELISKWITNQENEGESGYQMFDDHGTQVGDFLGFAWDRRVAVVALEVEGHSMLAYVNRNTIWWDEHLYFTDPDCQGDAYLPFGLFHGSWFEPALVIAQMPLSGNPGSRLVFMPVGDPIPNGHDDPPFQIIRHGTAFECVEDNGPGGHYVPVGTLNRIDDPGAPVDLGQDYQGPFRLEK